MANKIGSEMTIKERISTIGIGIADSIIETVGEKVHSGKLSPIIALFVITCVFTNSTATDVRKVLNLSETKYKNNHINRVVEEILAEASEKYNSEDKKNGKEKEKHWDSLVGR